MGGLALGLLHAVGGCAGPPAQRFTFTHRQMGTRFKLILYSRSRPAASDAAEAAFDRVDALNQTLSDYIRDSELMRLCREAGGGDPVRVSEDLFSVLKASKRWSRRSGGAFDITVGPFVRLWRRARKMGRLPRDFRLEKRSRSVGYEKIQLHPDRRAVELTATGMRLDVGGIAKGYTAEQVLALLNERGLDRVLIDAGGDVTVGDPPPGERGWRIAVDPLPTDRGGTGGDRSGQSREQPGGDERFPRYLVASNVSVATSGDAFRYVEINGQRYSHVIDPRTGVGLRGGVGVTVIAPNGTDADALASAVSVLGPEKGLELVNATPGAAAIVAEPQKAGGVKVYESERVDALTFVEE